MHKIIDIHTHGAGGYDTRTTDVSHILRIAEEHAMAGITEIIPTIYPATIKVMRENMMIVKKAMEIQNEKDKMQKGARIIGINLEGPFLNPSKCGALNAMTFIEPTEHSLQELIEGFEGIIKIITVAPELDGSIRLIKKISDFGIIVNMGHSDATYSEAEQGFHAGAKGITHIFNAMKGFHHRDPGLAGFGLLNDDIYIEVIADSFHLHKKTLELIFKIKNPDRIIIVSDTVKESIFKKKSAVTDNRGKLLGGCLPVTESIKIAVDAGLDTESALRCITVNPLRYLSG